jgi:gas vesicle protein
MRTGKYESSGSGAGTSIAFLLIGMGIGAAAGLLLAPKTGKQLRRDIQRSYDDVMETISDWSDEARERLKDALEKGSDFADELRAKAEPIGDFLRRS